MRAAIVGVSGLGLGADEAALLRAMGPAGVILFGRNVAEPAQVRGLIASLREVLPDGAVVAVDQEGGRVARLRPPGWRAHPAAGVIGASEHAERAAWLTGALIGLDCVEAGFDLVCAPVLDLRVGGASGAVGDRSFGSDPGLVARLGGAVVAGLSAAGAMAVGKHAPGHGRALVDSHFELPVVAAAVSLEGDIAAFAGCVGLAWLMTAHLLYLGVDAARPGTLSARVIGEVIRGRIGFGGVLVSDDLAMKALTGSPDALAGACVAAGCDVALHCTGVLAESAAVLRGVPFVSDAGLERMAAARGMVRPQMLDGDGLAAERERLFAC